MSKRSNRPRDPRLHSVSTGFGPDVLGTVAIVVGCALASASAGGASASEVAKGYSTIIGIGLATSAALDFRHGTRNVLRTDLLCLICLYYLTLAEFLFPQPDFDAMQSPASVGRALDLVTIAFVSIALARHLIPQIRVNDQRYRFADVGANQLAGLLFVAASLGYLHMFLAVNFNPVAFFEAMTGPRFSVPWARGKLGGWKELINELGLLLNVVPALAGVLWNRRRQLGVVQKALVPAICFLTLLYGISSGTRNILAGYLAAFLGSYLLTHPRLSLAKGIIAGAGTAALFFFASYHMLEFRNMGLANYLQGKVYASDTTRETLFVDYNLHAIAELTHAFPDRHDYLGFEIPMWAIIKPIPRAIWSGKPQGLSVGIEEAIGAEGLTIATTFIGEAYMSFGLLGVIGFSVILAFAASWWNRFGNQISSIYTILVYASGLIAFAITMRSVMWFTTAILPAAALVIVHWLWLHRPAPREKKERAATKRVLLAGKTPDAATNL